jgi:hypothetical protein
MAVFGVVAIFIFYLDVSNYGFHLIIQEFNFDEIRSTSQIKTAKIISREARQLLGFRLGFFNLHGL